MNRDFDSIRFKLFTQSYSGLLLADYLKTSPNAIVEIAKIAKVLLLKEFRLKRFVLDGKYRKAISRLKVEYKLVNTQKISVYLQIERELYNLQEMRKDREKFSEFEYENGNMLLELAIERTTGNRLKNVASDKAFDEKFPRLTKIYKHWYYTVAYTYKLPTVRILPFIIRLIS